MTAAVLGMTSWGNLAAVLVVLCALMLPVSLIVLVAMTLARPGWKAKWYFVGGLVIGVFGLVMLPQAQMQMTGTAKFTCRDNLLQIGRACLAYAADHDGWLPPDEETLFGIVAGEPGVLVCPRDRLLLDLQVMPAETARRLIRASPSYVYVGGYNLNDVGGRKNEAILAYGRACHHDSAVGLKHRGVVFADGRVAYFVERTFSETLRKHTALLGHLSGRSTSADGRVGPRNQGVRMGPRDH